MDTVRWGIIGCGDVTESKSGPGLQKAEHSELIAVMRRDGAKAEDYAKRHGVPRFYNCVDALIVDPEVNAIYIATPPSSHLELALRVAEVGKPCLVEKPMAMNLGECQCMLRTFDQRQLPLFVAYYRRALPRFLKVRQLLREGIVGEVSSVHIVQYEKLATPQKASGWRLNPYVAGGGLFMDLASHGFDLLDFLLGPIVSAQGLSLNTADAYDPEDVTVACFGFETGIGGTGVWNFNADHNEDQIIITGSGGELRCPVFSDSDVILRRRSGEEVFEFRNPPHVHQPLVQSVVDELRGVGLCESTAESAMRTAWILDECLANYYPQH